MAQLTSTQILETRLDDWRMLASALHARFLTADFATGVRFLTAVADAAELADHHPDVDLRYTFVDVALVSHDVSRVTRRDIRLARRISDIALEHGIRADPSAVSEVELGLDTADLAALGPFWAAVLTGSTASVQGNDVVDPRGRVPLLWFQETDAHDVPRQRFHLDLWVPHDVAEQRIAAAVEAGGRVVSDEDAPAFVVLADPDGNRVCVCTFLGR